jgi:bifunctional ADP-heptose synthase (sugar kinase/adenylyltransferase)
MSFQANGSTHRGEIRQSGGGVGRNIADALGKLGARPFLISAIGNDHAGDYLVKNTLKHIVSTTLSYCSTFSFFRDSVDKEQEVYVRITKSWTIFKQTIVELCHVARVTNIKLNETLSLSNLFFCCSYILH